MQDFRKLHVWQIAQELSVDIYRYCADFPDDERYGLTSQIRRAAVSVGSNIAEGSKRRSRTDKARLFNVSEGSAAEVGSELDIARRLGYGELRMNERLTRAYDELAAMIDALRERVLAGHTTKHKGT